MMYSGNPLLDDALNIYNVGQFGMEDTICSLATTVSCTKPHPFITNTEQCPNSVRLSGFHCALNTLLDSAGTSHDAHRRCTTKCVEQKSSP